MTTECRPKSNLSLYEKTKIVADGKQIFEKVQTDHAHVHLRLNCQDAKIADIEKNHKEVVETTNHISSAVESLHERLKDIEELRKGVDETCVKNENLETYDANLRVSLDGEFKSVREDFIDVRSQIQVLYNKLDSIERLLNFKQEPAQVREAVDVDSAVVEKEKPKSLSRGLLVKTQNFSK